MKMKPHPRRERPAHINHGRWTARELAVFEQGYTTYGKEWKVIADLIQTRTIIQVRTHAQKYFQKLAKHTGGPVMSTSKKEKLNSCNNSSSSLSGFDDLEEEDDEITQHFKRKAPPTTTVSSSKKPRNNSVLSEGVLGSLSGDDSCTGCILTTTIACKNNNNNLINHMLSVGVEEDTIAAALVLCQGFTNQQVKEEKATWQWVDQILSKRPT